MKRRPDLPPRPRGRPARRLTSAATRGRLELPICQACRTVQYPVREICRQCLSDNLQWEEVEAGGIVLSGTLIRHSTDPYLQQHQPLGMASVRLDAGPVVMARYDSALAPLAGGTRIRIQNQLDRSGEAILVAIPEEARNSGDVLRDPNRDIAGKTVLITGADGGIGKALVKAFTNAGAAKVIAATRRMSAASDDAGASVQLLTLDVTDPEAVTRAAELHGQEVDILVNNAGFTAVAGLLDADTLDGAQREMQVNYFGTLSMIRAFAPHFRARRQGTIVNVLSVLAHACLPSMGSYCASKAAALSLTQGVRAELLPWGVRVCAIFPSTVDTPASADSPPPKLSPMQVATAVVSMIRDGTEEHYPGPIATDLIAALRTDAKSVEREMALGLPEPR